MQERLMGCRAVLHLAAVAHHRRGSPAEEVYEEVNHQLARRVANAAREVGVDRIVLVSTAKVMGERSDRPFNEFDTPAPKDAYARSKLAAERTLLELNLPGRFEVVVARPPLVYGQNARANFAALMRLAGRRWPLPFSDATAVRSLVHIDNLVDALLFLCESPHAAGRTFFVTDGTEVSVADLVGRYRRLRGRPPSLFPLPAALRELACAIARRAGVELAPVFERLFSPLQFDAAGLRAIGWHPPLSPEAALDATLLQPTTDVSPEPS